MLVFIRFISFLFFLLALNSADNSVDTLTFSEYAQFYIKVKIDEGLKPSTIARYQGIIDTYLLPYFSRYDLALCNKVSTIRSFILALTALSPSGSVSRKSRKNIISVLTGVLQEAFYDETIESNGAKKIPPTKLIKPDIMPFASHEVKLILDASKGWFRIFLAVSFYSGLRTGEVFALLVKDVDLKNNLLHVNKSRGKFGVSSPKTKGSIRSLPIFAPLKAFLIPYISGKKPDDYLIINQYGNPFNDSSTILRRHWYPLLNRLGLTPRVMYQTRHTFATNMLESGKFSVVEISRYMGHVNTQMIFQRYTSYIDSEKRRTNIAVDIYFKNYET